MSLLLNALICKIIVCSFVPWAGLAGVAYSSLGAASSGNEACADAVVLGWASACGMLSGCRGVDGTVFASLAISESGYLSGIVGMLSEHIGWTKRMLVSVSGKYVCFVPFRG